MQLGLLDEPFRFSSGKRNASQGSASTTRWEVLLAERREQYCRRIGRPTRRYPNVRSESTKHPASCRRPDSIPWGRPTGKAKLLRNDGATYATPVARLTPTARHIPETSLALSRLAWVQPRAPWRASYLRPRYSCAELYYNCCNESASGSPGSQRARRPGFCRSRRSTLQASRASPSAASAYSSQELGPGVAEHNVIDDPGRTPIRFSRASPRCAGYRGCSRRRAAPRYAAGSLVLGWRPAVRPAARSRTRSLEESGCGARRARGEHVLDRMPRR